MSPLRSVGARLSLALLAVVAAALAVVYAILVPSLERRLVDERLSQLERTAPSLARRLPSAPVLWQPFAQSAADIADARVVLYEKLSESPLVLQVLADSRFSGASRDVEDDAVAARAATSFRRERGTVTRGGERFAEVAQPVGSGGPVLLLSAPLRDSLATVELTERRLLVAGLFALAVALAGGYAAASLFARRIRRLERAAERIARGRFDEAVADSATDELGELAGAFERMRQRLAQLDRARGEFIANASHELRTPLFALGGFLELLADEDLDDGTRREFLEDMREQIARLARLATDLLDLSRLDAGRLHLELAPLDLAATAQTLADEFRAAAQAAEHDVETLAEGPVPALADEGRVLQIGRILLENALVHTGASTTVRMSARNLDGRALLAVEDDGPGVPAADAVHVFERFYRSDGARASGSGLGLAIARELAEAMGGEVTLDSRPGRTVFTLALPAAAATRAAAATATAAGEPAVP